MLTLIFGMIQLALLFTASILTDYAAYAAARSAMVVIPEGDSQTPPGSGHSSPENAVCPPPDVDTGGTGGWTIGGVTLSGLCKSSTPYQFVGGSPGRSEFAAYNSARYKMIHRAAHYVMTTVSPPLETFEAEQRAGPASYSVERAIDPGEPFVHPGEVSTFDPSYFETKAAAKTAYAREATAVVLLDSLGAIRGWYDKDEEVYVRVSYLFRCSIPLVSRLVCRSFADLAWQVKSDLKKNPYNERFRGGDVTGWFLPIVREAHMKVQGQL